MAIARKIDPAALARSFADAIRAVPEVQRLWFHGEPSRFEPDRLALSFYVLLDPETDAAHTSLADALIGLQEEYFDEAVMSMETFMPCHVAVKGLGEILLDGSIEIPLRGA